MEIAMACKAPACNNVVSGKRVYCSPSCRTRTTNLLYKDYKKSGDTLRNKKKSEYSKKYCLECSKELSYELRENKYCNHSCSARHTNSRRKHSDDTRQKIAASVTEYAKTINRVLRTPRNCLVCSTGTKNKVYCSNSCAILDRTAKANASKTEREIYKAACKFTFGIRDYPDKFDTTLVEQYGWYSAKNRGNNVSGVSRDHMLSISDGFEQNVPPEMISHPANCRLVLQSHNASKGKKSSITREELEKRIEEW